MSEQDNIPLLVTPSVPPSPTPPPLEMMPETGVPEGGHAFPAPEKPAAPELLGDVRPTSTVASGYNGQAESPVPSGPRHVGEVDRNEVRTGNYEQGTVDNGYAQSSYRNGVGESARGRPLDGDHHSELTNIHGGSYTDSSVGHVSLDGEQYNVKVTQFRIDGVINNTYVGIAPASDPMNSIVTLSTDSNTPANRLTPEMRALANAAVSPNGNGGTALTYQEAKGILVEGLSCPPRPPAPPEPELPAGSPPITPAPSGRGSR